MHITGIYYGKSRQNSNIPEVDNSHRIDDDIPCCWTDPDNPKMPGLSFLFKKRFHPSRLDNQKRIFIAEEKQAEKNEREVESAKEVMKEKEMQHYEQCGSMDFRDPRTSALKFMYATPMAKDDEKDGKNTKKMASVMDYESKIDHKTGDDEMVRAFRAKIVQTKLKSLSESLVQQKTVGEEGAQYEVEVPANQSEHTESRSSKRKAAPAVSALEKEVGKRRTELTHDQMQERFAVLKNAPMEGGYAKGMAVKHKPFNELLRNVHCARCGEWGHMSGERECPLRDYNPLDYARQQREDPMRKMMDAPVPASSSSAAHPSCAADRHSRSGQSHTDSSTRGSARDSNTSSGVQGHRSSSRYVDEAGESDPEAEFLASLTRREKMLLLRKLQVSGRFEL
jgi:CBF1 interacting corepressor